MHLPPARGATGERGGDTLLRRLPAVAPGVVPVVLTGYGTIADAVAALKRGATDYLTKPLVDDTLRAALAAAAARHALLVGAAHPNTTDGEGGNGGSAPDTPRGMVGADPAMTPLYRGIAAAADGSAPVLVTGEPGVGKDLTARAIHAAGRARRAADRWWCTPPVTARMTNRTSPTCGRGRRAAPSDPRHRPALRRPAPGAAGPPAVQRSASTSARRVRRAGDRHRRARREAGAVPPAAGPRGRRAAARARAPRAARRPGRAGRPLPQAGRRPRPPRAVPRPGRAAGAGRSTPGRATCANSPGPWTTP